MVIESNGQEFCGYPAGDCVCAEKLKEVEEELKALREVADVAKRLLDDSQNYSTTYSNQSKRLQNEVLLSLALFKSDQARHG